METSDIVSPTYSIASNILKLNSSSIASSTPGDNHRFGPSVTFEQFSQSQNNELSHRPSLPKKRLTIEIEEDYHFQELINQPQQQAIHPQIMIPTPLSQNSELLSIQTQNIMSSYEMQIKNWRHQLEQSQLAKRQQQIQNQQLKQQLKKKDQHLLKEQAINNELTHKLASFEELQAQERFYDQKMREKQGKYRDLQKIHQKVVNMNKNLQKELRQSEKKIMELEKQVQRNICTTHQQNLVKIKESSSKLKQSSLKLTNLPGKENALTNVAKSVQRKKVTSIPNQMKKTGRISSSTTNIAKKLQLKQILI